MKRVGYWMSEKKSKKINLEDHVDMFRNAGVELLKSLWSHIDDVQESAMNQSKAKSTKLIDLEKSLEDQGPFDMILHKFTDILVKSQQGYITEQRIMHHIEDYIENHPECIIVDPLDGIRKLLDRHEQYNLVLDCNSVNTESYMFIPTFVDLTSKDVDENRQKLIDANVQYPFVCKPIMAHGTNNCHKMAVIFNEEGLKDISPPCVAQTFVNHNATLYKIFKIGSKQYIGQRPSLKNLYAGDHPTIFFDTHEVCKSDSSHHLTELDEEEMGASPLRPNLSKLNDVGETLRQKLKIDLFGVDVIIECDTQRYAVIDINVFPSYDEVDNFFGDLLEHLLNMMNHQQEKHSIQVELNTRQGHTNLREMGRTKSDESDHISCKRLKTLDTTNQSSFTHSFSGCEIGHVQRNLIGCNSVIKKQAILSSEERRNRINSGGKNTACRLKEREDMF